MPAFIANAPALLPGLGLYYDAFQQLCSSDRSLDWGMIDRYCQVHGIFGETRELMFHYVPALDVELKRLAAPKTSGGNLGRKSKPV
jgi:hypothetical protein